MNPDLEVRCLGVRCRFILDLSLLLPHIPMVSCGKFGCRKVLVEIFLIEVDGVQAYRMTNSSWGKVVRLGCRSSCMDPDIVS